MGTRDRSGWGLESLDGLGCVIYFRMVEAGFVGRDCGSLGRDSMMEHGDHWKGWAMMFLDSGLWL